MGLAGATGPVVGCLAALGCGGPGPTSSSFERADASVVPADPSVGDGGSASTDAGPPCSFLIQEFGVMVTDQRTGEAICDATVVAQGPMSVSFEVQGLEASCSYIQSPQSLAGGSYTVDVTAPGYQAAQRTNLLVTVNACGYSAPTVTIALVPIATVTDASVDQATAETGNGGPPDAEGAD